MEYSAYEEATVPICTFVLKNKHNELPGYYYRLSDFKGGMEVQKQKVIEANQNKDCGYFYETVATNFSKIPGSPIAYWMNQNWFSIFMRSICLEKEADVLNGLFTCDNNRFLKLWFEVNKNCIFWECKSMKESCKSNLKWYPYNKGGNFRKWYGNREYLVNFQFGGDEVSAFRIKKGQSASMPGKDKYFHEGYTYSDVTSGAFSARYIEGGFIFDLAGSMIFPKTKDHQYDMLGFLNSKVANEILKVINPTIHCQAGNLRVMPILPIEYENKKQVILLTQKNIKVSKYDWDSFEPSWDFTVHPLVKNHVSLVSEAYSLWSKECDDRFNQLKANEEELNRIFIDIYGLQDELDPYVEDKDVTVRKADLERDIKSLISYAVGCMFGRYSLDVEGLAYAGGEFDWSKYQSFMPDKDNIIPICDDEYFEDDIVGRFIKFIEVVYGESTLDENLSFIASALGGKGNPREVIRSYFLNDFYKDHCKIYQKRPIYWLFDSGKKNGFKALIYIHRYQPDLIARLRTDYVHETQSRLNHSVDMINTQLDGDLNSSEKVRLNKELTKFKAQAEEVKKYEEIVHHWADKMEPMDLDDGVKVNYEKFKDLLAKIK